MVAKAVAAVVCASMAMEAAMEFAVGAASQAPTFLCMSTILAGNVDQKKATPLAMDESMEAGLEAMAVAASSEERKKKYREPRQHDA